MVPCLLLLLLSLSLSNGNPYATNQSRGDIPVRKVVVVMMENHSFDHLLGWLPGVGSLKEKEFYNENWNGERIYAASGLDVGTGGAQDRPHDAKSVITQMWGAYSSTPGPDPSGEYFVKQVFPQSSPQNVTQQQMYMTSYSPESSPALSFLASNFVTCNRFVFSLTFSSSFSVTCFSF
jgi:phospholipase C